MDSGKTAGPSLVSDGVATRDEVDLCPLCKRPVYQRGVSLDPSIHPGDLASDECLLCVLVRRYGMEAVYHRHCLQRTLRGEKLMRDLDWELILDQGAR